MPRPPTDKRERVIHAAVNAVHAQGFHSSTLADIARSAGVPVGSVYYFFKAKQDLGLAVIDAHLAHQDGLQQQWAALDGPQARLAAFLQMTLDHADALVEHGCPVGTLCAELRKEPGPLGERAARIFQVLLDWLEAQFRELGHGTAARGRAEHLLGAVQGATLLAHTFGDATYLDREVERLTRWIQSP